MGELDPFFGLAEALQYIDFGYTELIKECFLVMHFSKGGVSFKELKELEFDKYEMFVKEALRIQKENVPKETTDE